MVTVSVREWHSGVGAIVWSAKAKDFNSEVYKMAVFVAHQLSKKSDGTFIVYENEVKKLTVKNGVEK